MVKKTSLLDKLVGRWRTSPVEVHEGRMTGGGAAGAAAAALKPEVAEVLAQPVVERSTRKLGVKEEALITLDGGLKELANLMRGVQVRLDAEGARVHDMANDVRALPALAQTQIEVLRALATQVQQQGQVGERLLQAIGGLPGTLEGLRASIDKLTALDERTATTLTEFRGAMDAIEASMREMVGHSRAQAENTEKLVRSQDARAERLAESMAHIARAEQEKSERFAQALERTVGSQKEHAEKLARSMESAISMAVQGATRDGTELREAVQGLQRSHEATVKGLRLAQEDQATRLQRMVEEQKRGSRALLGVLVALLVAVLAIGGVLLVR